MAWLVLRFTALKISPLFEIARVLVRLGIPQATERGSKSKER